MGYFYFDESIQERGQFIIGAFIYSQDDLSPLIFEALKKSGLRPKVDEFKSSAKMTENSAQFYLRNLLREMLSRIKIGFIILPAFERKQLGDEAIKCLQKILRANCLEDVPHKIYFDEGVSFSEEVKQEPFFEKSSLYDLHLQQDSKIIGGIQMADLVAHTLGTMLAAKRGLISKKVRVGENSGYQPDAEWSIDFELWAWLRHSFFMSPNPKKIITVDDPIDSDTYVDMRTYNVREYGLYVSPLCSNELSQTVLGVFGECYLGCIH